MRAHPMSAARLFARKLALVFSARHQWLDFSYPYYAHDVGSILQFLFVGPWLLVPLGMAGLIAAPPPSQRAEYYAWASFAGWYAIAVAMFFVAERYRLPLWVPLSVGAGGAVDRLMSAAGRAGSATRRTARLTSLAVVMAVAAILTAWPFNLPDGRFQERLRLSKVLMNRGDYGGAVSELEAALALSPGDSVTEFNLGIALVSSGRAQEGIAHVRRAVDAGVPIPGARYALAGALLSTGDRDQAVSLLRTYFPEPSDSAESCYHVGMLAIDAGAPVVAERFLKRALELRPGWPEAQQALARLSGRGP
jgi:Flp pilus assembly protein TadD